MATNTKFYEALIVGSGFSGISMAIHLKAAGIKSFVVLEQAKDIGGTWRDNTYPGAECDVPSALYSYSFEPFPDWKRKWADQSQILEYLRYNVKKYELTEHILCGQEFTSAFFDEEKGYWVIKTKQDDTYHARSLIMAVGQLYHPNVPDFKGKETFKGMAWHSARWNHAVDLNEKRVGVIGNAASAIQFIPEIAQQVQYLTIFQRSAKWILPKKNLAYSDKDRHLFRKFPFMLTWGRMSNDLFNGLFYHLMGQNIFWKKIWQGVSLSHLKKSIKDPELLKKLTPDYPMGANRVLLSDKYYHAVARENVDVNVEGISHMEEDGVVTSSGNKIPLDVIIYATGFESHPFLKGLDICGLNGLSINEAWKKTTETYLGITTAGFPNFFMMYGPNTNLGHSSVLLMIESQSHYIVNCLNILSAKGVKYMDVKPSFQRRFTHEVNERLKKTAGTRMATSLSITGPVKPASIKNLRRR